ncbi:MAG: DUF2079 domain-containing protein [Planctomycetia bacterium]|nr:DUF2079 domain-containing protein [Planctomycetia bacterium]
MPSSTNSRRSSLLSIASAAAFVLAGAGVVAFHVQSVLQDPLLARGIMSRGLWRQVVGACGGQIITPFGGESAEVPIGALLIAIEALALANWMVGAAWISRRHAVPFASALSAWGRWGWAWWVACVVWDVLDLVLSLTGTAAPQVLLRGVLPFWQACALAGWLTTLVVLGRRSVVSADETANGGRVPAKVRWAMALYFVCFATMNWMLYKALLVPHGDSAMYEEHIWNLLHGKGFRSYLDQGRLFLGEHIQVIHLAVIPLYVLWPSHLLLELCQSAWLAAGAVPVFRVAQRHSLSSRAAALVALAYLLYFPMQYLDIAVTYKTFRPNSFEIPFLLFALHALENGRYRRLLVWLGLALLCQEDAAMVIAPLGAWIAVRQARFTGVADRVARRRVAALGCGLAAFGTVYVLLVVKVVLPWFRGGEPVHFAQYFDEFGSDPGGIAGNVLSHPGRVLAKLCGVPSWLFALGLIAPLGLLPLFSPGRLAVAAPLFGVLCLSNITNSPLHHFHSPLVPVVVWAAAAGIPNLAALVRRWVVWRARNRDDDEGELARRRIPHEKFISSGKNLSGVQPVPVGLIPATRAPCDEKTALVRHALSVWCLACSLCSGLVMSLSPLGIGFWDPYSSHFWKDHYFPGERARKFPAVLALVPQESRVASTDYVHTRLTHHARSYDYSAYRPDVPGDADFIVIDTQHPYSRIKRPEEVKEYRDHPEVWELLDDRTDGYFIVLRRRK